MGSGAQLFRQPWNPWGKEFSVDGLHESVNVQYTVLDRSRGDAQLAGGDHDVDIR